MHLIHGWKLAGISLEQQKIFAVLHQSYQSCWLKLSIMLIKEKNVYCDNKVDKDPVYSAKKAGLGRGSARPFCHCKRTKRPNARPKTAAAETISRGSLGRGSARPFLTVNASRPKCGTKCDPRIRKYVWSSWHHRIWRHYPAFFFDRCSYFVFFFFCGDYQICPCKLLTKT